MAKKINDDSMKSEEYYRKIEINKLGELFNLSKDAYSWDLYDDCRKDKKVGDLISVDPRNDVSYNSYVCIDFGTKSTVVVVYDDDYRDMLDIEKIGVRNSDARNGEMPTILEFKNLKNFISDYNEYMGRPRTSIKDIKTSWEAYSDYISGDKKNYQFFNKLKQWTITNDRYKTINDDSGIHRIYNFRNKDKGVIDPLEIYAYYIGSYVNSISRIKNKKKIHLKYILSFPLTYTNNIKSNVLDSFRKGIKKSLPITVLEDEKIMEKFDVSFGCSEPEAYAITAFEEFGIKPKDDETILYSIFDFGGGTSDFSFGILRNDFEEKWRKNIINIYSYGEKYLGGENIVEELAAFIINSKDNALKLLNKGIEFDFSDRVLKKYKNLKKLSSEKETISFKNSQKLFSKVRDYWEKPEKVELKEEYLEFEELIDINDESVLILLEVNYDEIMKKLKEILKNGVVSFFESYVYFLDNILESKINYVANSKKYIILAGNSSRSNIFIEEFKNIFNKLDKSNNFILMYPLGTKNGDEQRVETNLNEDSPTAKTGVAHGLIEYKIQKKYKRLFITDNSKRISDKDGKKFYNTIHLPTNEKINHRTKFNYWKKIRKLDIDESEINLDINGLSRTISLGENFDEYKYKYIYLRIVSEEEIELGVEMSEDNIEVITRYIIINEM